MKIIGLHAQIIVDQFQRLFSKKGYVFFDGGKPFNVNIIGIRSDNPRAGKFDDTLLVIQRNSLQNWEVYSYQITTDPGAYYLQHPMNVSGTAILVPGQYRGAYKIGKHKGLYTALVQQGGKVKVWRDNNRDVILDWDSGLEHEGYYGINIHRSKKSGESSEVGRWSAGCQVFKNSGDFAEFMKLITRSAKVYGNRFTYTLIEQKDLQNFKEF